MMYTTYAPSNAARTDAGSDKSPAMTWAPADTYASLPGALGFRVAMYTLEGSTFVSRCATVGLPEAPHVGTMGAHAKAHHAVTPQLQAQKVQLLHRRHCDSYSYNCDDFNISNH